MRRSHLALGLGAGVLLALTACTAIPVPRETSEVPVSTPTRTVETLQVAPGGTPPVAFDQDCGAVLTEAQIADATGMALQFESTDSSGTMANVGGLVCVWRGDSATLVVEVIPQPGLGSAVFPADSQAYYFEDCDPQWVCSFRWEGDALWVAGTFQFAPDMTRENVDAWGSALGAQIGANQSAQPDAPWVRDRTGWWPVLDCQNAAAAIGRELGTPLDGEIVSLGDPPSPGHVMAGAASNRTDCAVSEHGAADTILSLSTAAGTGATTPDGFAPIDLDVDGIDAYAGGPGGFGGEQYYLSDGVNSASIEVHPTAALSAQAIVAAVARAAASGFAVVAPG